MSSRTGPAADEMAQAETLPQLDASSLVDGERLEAEVKDMYRHVAREEEAELHFEVGRGLAEHLGYPGELLDAIPAEALASFAGVGHHLDLAALQPGEDGARPRLGIGYRRLLRGGAGGRVGPRRRRGHHRRAARQGRAAAGPRRVLAGRVRRGAHRGAPLRGRELRRGHLERRDQPLARSRAGSSPRRRGSCGPEGGWRSPTSSAAGRSRSARGATSSCGPRASPGRSRAATTSRRSRRRACRSRRSGRTTTASSPSGRSTRAAPTRSRASRWSP